MDNINNNNTNVCVLNPLALPPFYEINVARLVLNTFNTFL
jgi:hypothetical protein